MIAKKVREGVKFGASPAPSLASDMPRHGIIPVHSRSYRPGYVPQQQKPYGHNMNATTGKFQLRSYEPSGPSNDSDAPVCRSMCKLGNIVVPLLFKT